MVNFTRFDVLPVGEKAKSLVGDKYELIPGVIPETHQQKTVEVTLELRPDVALSVANSILMTLANLSNERKAVYGIPTSVAPIAAVPPRTR